MTAGPWKVRVDDPATISAIGRSSHLSIEEGRLCHVPPGWKGPAWRLPLAEITGGAAVQLVPYDLWLEHAAIGRLAVLLVQGLSSRSIGGFNPDAQAALDALVAELTAGGAMIAGEPTARRHVSGGTEAIGLGLDLPGLPW